MGRPTSHHGGPAAPQAANQPRALGSEAPAGPQLLDHWLAALATRLDGPARARRGILTELHDGLAEAYATGRAAGLSPVEAAEAAIAEFGDPATVAAAFAPELAAAHARRVGLTLIATGPPVGALWLAALTAGGYGAEPAVTAGPPWHWPIVQALGWPARALLALVIVAILAAGLTVAATGRLTRWLPSPARLARTATATAAGGAGVLDLTLLATVALHLTSGAQEAVVVSPATWLLVTAAIVGMTRVWLAGRGAYHCLTTPRTSA